MKTKELSEKDIANEAVRFIETLAPEQSATVIGLHGDLGAGKTTFTQGLARALGIKESVTSPTFVIMKTYTLPKGDIHFSHLIHIDAYRLESGDELRKLGWETLLKDPHNLIVVEWADRIENILPRNTKRIRLDVSGETTRVFSYEN